MAKQKTKAQKRLERELEAIIEAEEGFSEAESVIRNLDSNYGWEIHALPQSRIGEGGALQIGAVLVLLRDGKALNDLKVRKSQIETELKDVTESSDTSSKTPAPSSAQDPA